MKRNVQHYNQKEGYPQQNGYPQGSYPPGSASYQGYPSRQGYQAPQGYPASQGYNPPQGYNAPQGYTQPQAFQQPGRSYQTPQVTGSQPAASPQANSASYTAQGTFPQAGYAQQPYNQGQGGYAAQMPYTQPQGYPQQPAAGNSQSYTYPGGQPAGAGYIPQTPYDQVYTNPGGYQQPAGYAQGYNAYSQMGRNPQAPMNTQPEMGGHVPLNGGGYVPQPVPVRKRPFVMTDAYLLIISGVLLILFALGMFAPGLGMMKWLFLILSGGMIALLWIRQLTAGNKRLCFTIIFGILMLVTIVAFAGGGKQTGGNQAGRDAANPQTSGQTEPFTPVPAEVVVTSAPSAYTPEPDQNSVVFERVKAFFDYWSANRQDDMLSLCAPSWQNKVENPKTALFGLMANRTPKDHEEENISGTPNDTTRTVTVTTLMDKNNGKDPVRYRLSVIMIKENDGLWYVDPQSLQTYENADTPDPSITNTPAPTETPAVYANTTLYYNPSGGDYYHLDQNCKRINERYLPLKGHFEYSQLGKEPYNKLKPCAICGAPAPGL